MKKILFLTNHSDHAVNSVISCLDRMSESYIRINTEDFFTHKRDLTLTLSGYPAQTIISFDNVIIDPEDIRSVCYRRPSFLINDTSQSSEYVQAQWKHCIWSLSTTFFGYWVNQPLWGKYLLEHNKLFQLKCALDLGFKVPATIVSNNHEEIINFCEQHGGIVACKPLRHTNLLNQDGNPVGIYTQMLKTTNFEGRKGSIRIAPMIVQQYIEKNVELRVTVIGCHVFACEIHSQDSDRTKHDWRRYDFDNVKHLIHQLPKEMTALILSLMQVLRLNFGAMDLILTPNGDYYFLEVNPTGQYGWIENLTGLPISETFAKALVSPIENGIKQYPL